MFSLLFINFLILIFLEIGLLLFIKTSDRFFIKSSTQILLHPFLHLQSTINYSFLFLILFFFNLSPFLGFFFNLNLESCPSLFKVLLFSYENKDNFTIYIQSLLLLVILIVHLISLFYLKYQKTNNYEYCIILQYATLFLFFLTESFNFMTFVISLIGTSIMVYTLLAIEIKDHGKEAALKYYFLSALTSGLLFYGLFLLLSIYNTLDFSILNWMLWSSLSMVHNWNPFLIEQFLLLNAGCIILIVIGTLFKLGAFPSHLWTIDIYEGSSNPVMSFFLMPMKLAIFAMFAKIINYPLNALHWVWELIIWLASLMSLLWGCLGAVTEQTIKKFVGYSSINQMGYLLIGLNLVFLEGYSSTILYLTIYMIMNIILLSILFSIKKTLTNERVLTLLDLNAFAFNNIWEITMLVIVLFSMAGIPPLAGFFGKFYLFLASIYRNYLSLVLMGMFTSAISTYYYLNFFSRILFIKTNISKHLVLEENYLLTKIKHYMLIFVILFIFLNNLLIPFIIQVVNIN